MIKYFLQILLIFAFNLGFTQNKDKLFFNIDNFIYNFEVTDSVLEGEYTVFKNQKLTHVGRIRRFRNSKKCLFLYNKNVTKPQLDSIIRYSFKDSISGYYDDSGIFTHKGFDFLTKIRGKTIYIENDTLYKKYPNGDLKTIYYSGKIDNNEFNYSQSFSIKGSLESIDMRVENDREELLLRCVIKWNSNKYISEFLIDIIPGCEEECEVAKKLIFNKLIHKGK